MWSKSRLIKCSHPLNLSFKLARELKIGGIKLRHEAAIFRKPCTQQLYSVQNFAFFILLLSRLMKLTAALYQCPTTGISRNLPIIKKNKELRGK
jgi:hypothetical protein